MVCLEAHTLGPKLVDSNHDHLITGSVLYKVEIKNLVWQYLPFGAPSRYMSERSSLTTVFSDLPFSTRLLSGDFYPNLY